MVKGEERRTKSTRIRLDSSVRRSIKVVLIGDSQSGKTSLRNRWLTNRFSSNYSATIGVDFLTKTLPLYPEIASSNSKATLSCWDTAGQERFRSISSSFYRGADAVIIQFDSSNSNLDQQKERIRFWFQEFSKMTPIQGKEETRRFTWIVVGGKSDLLVDSTNGNANGVQEIDVRNFLDELLPRKFIKDENQEYDDTNQESKGIDIRGYQLNNEAEVSSNFAIKSHSLITTNSNLQSNDKPLDGSESPVPPKEVLSRPDPNQLNPSISASTSSSSKLNSTSTPTSRKNSTMTHSISNLTTTETPRPRHKSLNSTRKALSNRKSIKSIDVFNPTESDDEFQNSWKSLGRSNSKLSSKSPNPRRQRTGSSSISKRKSFDSRQSNGTSNGQHSRNLSLDSTSPSVKSKGGLSTQSSKSNSKNSSSSNYQSAAIGSSSSNRERRKRYDSTISQISTSDSIYHTPRNSTYFASSSFRNSEDDEDEEEGDVESNFSFHENGSPVGKGKQRRKEDSIDLEIDHISTSNSHLKPSDANGDANSLNHRNSLALSDRSSTPTLRNRRDDLNGLERKSEIYSDEESGLDDGGLLTPKIEKESNPLIDEMILRSSSNKPEKRKSRDINHIYDDVGTGKMLNVDHENHGASEDEIEEEIGLANPILSGDPIPFPTTEEEEFQSDHEEEAEEQQDEDNVQNEEDWKDIPISKSNGKGKFASKDRKSRNVSDPFSTLRTIPPSEMDEEEVRELENHLRNQDGASKRKSRLMNGNEGPRSRKSSSVNQAKATVDDDDEDWDTNSDPQPTLSEGFSLIYTSSKTGFNVSKVFETVVERVVERWELEEWEERERSRMRRQFIKNNDKRKSTVGNWNFGMEDLGNGPPLGVDEESRREAVRRGIRIAAGKDPNPRGGWRTCC